MREFIRFLWNLPDLIWTMPGDAFFLIASVFLMTAGYLGFAAWKLRR